MKTGDNAGTYGARGHSRALWLGMAAVILAGLFVVSGCRSSNTAEPSPTSPAAETTDAWERIQEQGTMVVGTSADYPPFEFYRAGLNLDGFDIALMRAIGQQLGVTVQFEDYEFSGLGAAVLTGDVDAVIAAITMTPDRALWADFSDGYFTSTDGILAGSDATFDAAASIDLAGLTIGVQEGSIYATWAGRELIEPGLVGRENVKSYTKATDLPAAIERGEIDAAILDLPVAESFAADGNVRIVGSGLSEQQFAIAAAKGTETLLAKVNEALAALDADGTIDDLADEYEIGGSPDVKPLPPLAPGGPTTDPPDCINNLSLVQHLTHDDQGLTAPSAVAGGQPFVKSWRVLNSGTCTWTSDYVLRLVGTNTPSASMGGQPVYVQGEVAPGETYDFSVNLVAPIVPGLYVGFWSMADAEGVGFGQRLTVAVTVSPPATLTPVPTQTPSPQISFEADRKQIQQGECVTFTWDVNNIDSVYFHKDGEPWQNNGVTGQGSREECPRSTTTYNLRVVFADGEVETRSITIYVESVPDAPVISLFSAVPTQITEGQCVTVQWIVTGDVDNINLGSQGQSLIQGAPLQGSIQNCPTGSGSVDYTLDATGPGGTQQGREYVNVVAPSTATPAPTRSPDQPYVEYFMVLPPAASATECVNVMWSVVGGVSRVRVWREDLNLIDNASFQGNEVDCPGTDQPITYRLEIIGNDGVTTVEERFVNVTVAAPHQDTP